MSDILVLIQNLVMLLVALVIVGILLGFLGYLLILWYRWKDREEKSLELITLEVAVPKDNEVKIDAMEPILASLGSMYKSAKFKFLQILQTQPNVSLEIVGTKEDIRFYI